MFVNKAHQQRCQLFTSNTFPRLTSLDQVMYYTQGDHGKVNCVSLDRKKRCMIHIFLQIWFCMSLLYVIVSFFHPESQLGLWPAHHTVILASESAAFGNTVDRACNRPTCGLVWIRTRSHLEGWRNAGTQENTHIAFLYGFNSLLYSQSAYFFSIICLFRLIYSYIYQ